MGFVRFEGLVPQSGQNCLMRDKRHTNHHKKQRKPKHHQVNPATINLSPSKIVSKRGDRRARERESESERKKERNKEKREEKSYVRERERERERVFFIKLNGTIEFHFFLNWKHHINDFYHGRNHTKLDHKEIKFDIEIIFIKLSFEKGIFCKIVWKGHIATYLSKYEYLPILAAIYIYIYTHTHTHKFYLFFFFPFFDIHKFILFYFFLLGFL